jgi:phosphohistidine phosphatase
MNLYFIRHGIAEELGEKNEFSDEKRSLTRDGQKKMRGAARGMARLGIELDVLFTSPVVRAMETSEIIAAELGLKSNTIRQTPYLAPGAQHTELLTELKGQEATSVALVGHQPDLGDLVSRIVAGSGGLSIDLRKGGICCVEVTETVPSLRGDLVWLLTPKQLRLLGK